METTGKTSPECARADLGDFQAIYDDHARPVYYLALRFLGSTAQAEDAAHDVFLKAYRKLDTFNGKSSLRTWLYRITINHCRNLQQSWSQRNIHSCGDTAVLGHPSALGDNPLRVLEIKELGQRIQSALDALSEDYRLLLLLVADEEMSYQEIGDLTGQSVDAVRGKLHRARKAFCQTFSKTA